MDRALNGALPKASLIIILKALRKLTDTCSCKVTRVGKRIHLMAFIAFLIRNMARSSKLFQC
jgi:hypothetical protein